ncbi:MAG TPA: hypothetical protein VF376_14110 [Thermoanaerobaculia bacterium]
MEETRAVEPNRRVDSTAGAIRKLTFAVWCVFAAVVALLAVYFYPFYQSWKFTRAASSSASISSSPSPSDADGKGFFDLPPEERIKRASGILLTKHEPDGKRVKAIVVEILKQPSKGRLRWSVGDEIPELSHYPHEGTSYGDGDVVFFQGSMNEFRESMTYTNGRIMAMGDMPLDTLRDLVKGGDSASARPTISPLTGDRTVSASPVPLEAHRIDLEQETNGEGVTRVFSISPEAALRIPEWFPEKGEPPLSMSRAIQLATDAAQRQSPEHTMFVARAVRIQLASCDQPVGNRWYYVLTCVPREGGVLGMSRSVPIVVLMDGTVVNGRIKNG